MPTRQAAPTAAGKEAAKQPKAPEKLKKPSRNGPLRKESGLAPPSPEPEPSAPSPARSKPPLQAAPEIAAPSATLGPPATLVTSPPLPDISQDNAPVATPSPHGAGEAASKQGIIVVDGVEFHHASEAEFASLLTYYGIEWQYEPHQFPLQWRDDRVIEMFTPDFYLPEYDFYFELTTMRQALVRRKNRKLRLLRALYPEINIKLIYRRDYQRILARFGIRPEEPDQPPAGEEQD